jgi:hypothetical protein
MTRFYEPDLTANPDSPFVRDASNKLVRRSYWMDMPGNTLVMVMTKGIGANLTNDEKKAHLIDLYAFRRFCRRSPTASADDDSTISAAISVRYYKTSNRVACATTGQILPS